MFKKIAYEINELGYIVNSFVVEFDGDTIKDESKKHLVSIKPPDGLYRAKWTGLEWIEGATQEEIAELEKGEPAELTQTEILEQRLADVEVMLVEILFR